jgi:hypothetical protein
MRPRLRGDISQTVKYRPVFDKGPFSFQFCVRVSYLRAFVKMAGKDSDKPRGPPPGDLPKPEKLPAAFQKIIDKADNEDNFYDELYDGT